MLKIRTTQKTDMIYGDIFQIEVNGDVAFSVADGELEDNTLAQNFNDVYKIPDLIKQAYEAGARGMDIEIETITDEGE